MNFKGLGIYREIEHSPARESEDALILQAVAEELGRSGLTMTLASPEEADSLDWGAWDLILPMCERYPRLLRLRREARGIILNTPSSVLATYRIEMLQRLKDGGVPIPLNEVRRTEGSGPPRGPSFAPRGGFWVKRGDVHNTTGADVLFARNLGEAGMALSAFARREIVSAVFQEHKPGRTAKFYGTGPGAWFHWFFHENQEDAGVPPGSPAAPPRGLREAAEGAAAALGLEIFGGDAVLQEDGAVWIIDVNSWPSFARVRREAARAIAELAASMFFREKGGKS